MGIVHHSRYLPYLEEARVAYLRPSATRTPSGARPGSTPPCSRRTCATAAAALRRRGRRPPAAGVGQPHDVPDGLPADARRRGRGHRGHRPRDGHRRRSPDPPAGVAGRDGRVVTRWFTADLHFGHANIIRYCDRPFADVAGDGRRRSSTGGTTSSPPTTRCGCSATWRWARSSDSLAHVGRARRHQAARARQPRPLLARPRRPVRRAGPSATSPPGSPTSSTSRSTLTLGDGRVLACHFPYEGDSHDDDRFGAPPPGRRRRGCCCTATSTPAGRSTAARSTSAATSGTTAPSARPSSRRDRPVRDSTLATAECDVDARRTRRR